MVAFLCGVGYTPASALQSPPYLLPAGVMLSRAAGAARENGMKGMEFASGIPGTVGGAVVMNAGAYGGEMCHIIREATVLTKEGEEKSLSLPELELGYRYAKGRLAAITGTNGKSSIASIIADTYSHFAPCGYIGTIAVSYGEVKKLPSLTTPDPISIHSTMKDMVNAGMKACALEVSSHGLELGRVC